MEKKQKKPLSNKALIGIWTPIIAIIMAVVIFANVAISTNFMNVTTLAETYVGKRPSIMEQREGAEKLDGKYYDQQYATKEEATAAAEKVVIEIGEEGIVLMKNNGALPLDPAANTVSLIGRFAADPVYGGAGSGTVDPATCYDFSKGLTAAGFKLNETAFNWIKSNAANYPRTNIVMDNPAESTYYIGEIPYADYPENVQSSINGTTAVIVLGRGGGEGGDLSHDLKATLESGISANFVANAETANYEPGQHQLELNKEEKDLIAAAKASCDKVIVILNASTSMEIGCLMAGEYEVDAVLNCGSIGSTAAYAVGEILAGQVNPSGRTTDLWAADFTKDPTFYNQGEYHYTDIEGYYTQATSTAYFVEYEEGIYIGYRYYETADAEAKAGNYPGFNYDEAVVLPFGYGLSYTTFEQKLDSCEIKDDMVVAKVTVTNTGDVAGKEVVQVYYTAPYTPGGIEKSAVVLGNFEKTGLLQPGASETVTVTFAVRDMASYDSSKAAYVQDAGEYIVSLRKNSHEVIDSKSFTLKAEVYDTDSQTGNEISNKFDDTTEYMAKNCTNMSRADFAGTFPTPGEDKTAASTGISFAMYNAADHVDETVEMPVTGANNGLQLIDLRGKDYDDPAWDTLLDQITVEEMLSVLNEGAYNTAAVASIAKPATSDPDGPQGFTSLMGTTGNCSYCSEYLMAQTWSKETMYKMGQMIGQEALASGYNGWYAPAMNTHRSPFAGRNFEYYSEDGVLGGQLAAATLSGCGDNGVYAYIKHFALNDQETQRTGHVMTWATEQAIRELYLKPFELAIKNAVCTEKYLDEDGNLTSMVRNGFTAVMSSFNYVGTEWAGGRQSLMTGILRDEWGFQHFAITDFNLYDYMNKNQGWYAGTDHMLTWSSWSSPVQDTTSASAVASMRQCMHRLLYTVVNSNAMNNMVPGTTIRSGYAWWDYTLWGVSGALTLFCIGAAICVVKRCKKNKEAK